MLVLLVVPSVLAISQSPAMGFAAVAPVALDIPDSIPSLGTMRGSSSFVDSAASTEMTAAGMSMAPATPADTATQAAVKSLDGLVKNAEDELTYLENSVQSNLDWSTKMEGALKMIQRTAQRERAHTNKLGGLYGSLTQQVRSLESAQGQTSAQQGSQKLVAAQLSEMGSTEDRELENTDSERDTQKVKLDALSGTLFGKIQAAQAHYTTLTTWAMQTGFNVNVATSEMEALRGDMLTMDDSITSLTTDLLSLFREVQGLPAAKKAEV